MRATARRLACTATPSSTGSAASRCWPAAAWTIRRCAAMSVALRARRLVAGTAGPIEGVRSERPGAVEQQPTLRELPGAASEGA